MIKKAIMMAAGFALLAVFAAISLRLGSRASFNEVVAYFDFPAPRRGEMIKLTITARAPKEVIERRIETQRHELHGFLLEIVASTKKETNSVRENRRKILEALSLQEKTRNLEIEVVPDLSVRQRNGAIQKILEKSKH